MSIRDWLRGLPKAELHVHLEGTLTPQLYERIAERNGISADDAGVLFQCKDFESFLKAFLSVVRTLHAPQDFADIAAAYLNECEQQGIRHVELMFSPGTIRHFHPHVDLVAIVSAIHEQCRRAAAEHGVSSLIVLDTVRNLGQDAAMADIELATQCRSFGIVGVGLGGDERRFPARDFQQAFEKARQRGLRRTVHAGEAAGRSSIEDAVELLHAERIGHGIAAAGHPDLQSRIRERGITIDTCPTSNAVTGAWDRLNPHPIAEFMRAGVAVTLSSDDPGFFGCSLLHEYQQLAESGFSRMQLAQIARTSLSSSFASEQEKRIWLDELDAYLAQSV